MMRRANQIERTGSPVLTDEQVRTFALRVWLSGVYPSEQACAKKGLVCKTERFYALVTPVWRAEHGIPDWPAVPEPSRRLHRRRHGARVYRHRRGKESALIPQAVREQRILEHQKRVQAHLEMIKNEFSENGPLDEHSPGDPDV
jgi:hypothetical protein